MNNKGADQTARMRRLVCAFVVCKSGTQDFFLVIYVIPVWLLTVCTEDLNASYCTCYVLSCSSAMLNYLVIVFSPLVTLDSLNVVIVAQSCHHSMF